MLISVGNVVTVVHRRVIIVLRRCGTRHKLGRVDIPSSVLLCVCVRAVHLVLQIHRVHRVLHVVYLMLLQDVLSYVRTILHSKHD